MLTHESDGDSRVFFADPHYAHYIGMISLSRPGVVDCFQALEFTHFAHGTPRHDSFHRRVIIWQGIMWEIVSIPIAEKELIQGVAQACRLRLANGIPMVIAGGGVHKFPFESANFFVLENIAGHPAYRP